MKLKKYFFSKTKSTNDLAMKKIKKGKKKGIIIANHQTKGRGQYGKKWISLKGNLFMSIFFEIKNNDPVNKITKDNCKIVKKAISKFTKEKIYIKQPNDLLIKRKKICGILQEILIYEFKKFLIVGIGMNIKNSPKIKNYPTTYLNNHCKKNINTTAVYKEIQQLYENKLG